VADGFDGVENGEAAAAEHFEVNTETFIDHFCERQSPVKQRARAGDKILHQTDIALVKAALHDVALGETVVSSNVKRNVDAALFKVARDVLPEVGKLQGGAGRVGKALALLVTIAAEIKDQLPHRVGGINAVAKNGVPTATLIGTPFLATAFIPPTLWGSWSFISAAIVTSSANAFPTRPAPPCSLPTSGKTCRATLKRAASTFRLTLLETTVSPSATSWSAAL